MEKFKKSQRLHRSAFTRCLNALNEELQKDDVNPQGVTASFQLLENKMAQLDDLQTKILDTMLEEETVEESMQQEMITADEYRGRYIQAMLRARDFINPVVQPVQTNSQNSVDARATHHFPRLEIPKFDGNVKHWLQFWSQFQKIDKDVGISLDDKFQYLLQAIVPGSRAHDLILSFPPIGENYQKAVKSLEERFGRKDLLIEVYVRELLELVLKNVVKREKVSLTRLYDKLETQMRALETLGVTASNCAAMLFPLVESSLPEDLLRTWQRTTHDVTRTTDASDRLKALMTFLRAEVQNEERINMAVQGFSLSTVEQKIIPKVRSETKKSGAATATAVGLLTTNGNKTSHCIFCKASHESTDCEIARKMTFEKKRAVIKENNCCFNCLKKGHSFNRCRTNLKCSWCNKRHAIVVCPLIQKPVEKCESVNPTVPTANEHNLTNLHDASVVYLQTLRTIAYNGNIEIKVRVIIDSGSQRSYITKSLVRRLNYEPIGVQKIAHSLFAGERIVPKTHEVFLIHVKNMNGSYACNFKVRSVDRICDTVTCIKPAPWLENLRKNNINLTDVDNDCSEIDILIGADVAGKLFTGGRMSLENDLTAIETLLGWTVMGEPKDQRTLQDASLMSVSLFLQEADISDFWRLDVLGIVDPATKKGRLQRDEEIQTNFCNMVRIDADNRYQIKLPWVEDHAPLPTNELLAKKRLFYCIKTVKSKNLKEKYDNIFNDWLCQGVIEKVPEGDMSNAVHFLPHKPVVKASSTTPIRPVFDASAKERDSPSLNQCLEKGSNLIELIPSILLRFRKGKIGVIADIEKAFLQISVAPTDRDYLRFFWEEHGQMTIFRHRRLVFGLTCSPFLLSAVIKLHLQRACQHELSKQYDSEVIALLKDGFYVDNCIISVDHPDQLEKFKQEATSIMNEGRFTLRCWEHSHDGNNEPTMVLGMLWHKDDDTLSLNLPFLEEAVPSIITKRIILSMAHRLYDPIGIACAIMIQPKLLLQKAWLLELNWDVPITGPVRDEFIKLV